MSDKKSQDRPRQSETGGGNPHRRTTHQGSTAAGHGKQNRRKPTAPTVQFIFGLHAAAYALTNPQRTVLTIRATENAARRLARELEQAKTSVETVAPRVLDRLVGSDAVHQGIVLEVGPLETLDLATIAERCHASGRPIVILDQVTDPHNVGAVLRSCAVFGAAGLVMTERHSPPLGATLAKSASGALDLMPVCLVRNLAKAIADLEAQAIPVIGLDGESEHALLDAVIATSSSTAVGLALGAEGKGLRELTRETCTSLARIAGDGPIASLNVSNAAAIALHLAAMRRRA